MRIERNCKNNVLKSPYLGDIKFFNRTDFCGSKRWRKLDDIDVSISKVSEIF